MARPGRLTIRRVQMLTAGLGVVATVQLGLEGAVYEGTAEGAATVTSVHRSVAIATLRAVESVVNGEPSSRSSTWRWRSPASTALRWWSSPCSPAARARGSPVHRSCGRTSGRRWSARSWPQSTGVSSRCWTTNEPRRHPGVAGRAGPARGGSVHVRRVPPGRDSLEPAVLVHGLGGSATNWTDVMGLLKDRVDARAPDLPGFGWSPPPPDANYSPEAHARTLVESSSPRRGTRASHGQLARRCGRDVGRCPPARPRPDLTLVSPALPVYRPRADERASAGTGVPFIGQRLAATAGKVPVEARVRATLALCFADPSLVPPQRFERPWPRRQDERDSSTRRRDVGESPLPAHVVLPARTGHAVECGRPGAGSDAADLWPAGQAGRPAYVRACGPHLPAVPAPGAPKQRSRRADGTPRARGHGGAQVPRPDGPPRHRPPPCSRTHLSR